MLAHPEADARIDVAAVERAAFAVRYGADIGDESDAAIGDVVKDSTRVIQNRGASDWVRRCAAAGVAAVPASPEHVALMVERLFSEGRAFNSIKQTLYAIEALHGAVGVGQGVSRHWLVTRMLKKVARERGRHGGYRRDAMLPEYLRAALPYYEELARTQPVRAARDLAVLSLGIATALRGFELAALRTSSVTWFPNGMVLHITECKTISSPDDAFDIELRRIPDARICPVACLERYVQAARLEPGYLFRGTFADGSMRRSRMSVDTVGAIVKEAADAAGVHGNYSAHSLRVGAANAARRAGLGLDGAMRVTRHADPKIAQGYMRPDPEPFANDVTAWVMGS